MLNCLVNLIEKQQMSPTIIIFSQTKKEKIDFSPHQSAHALMMSNVFKRLATVIDNW